MISASHAVMTGWFQVFRANVQLGTDNKSLFIGAIDILSVLNPENITYRFPVYPIR